VATVAQCREAIETVAARMSDNPDPSRADLDRSFACTISDLRHSFHGRLAEGTIVDLTDGDDPRAQVRLTVTGDDLLAMVDGSLNFAKAWASGRLSVKASFRDLIRLRKLM
jgi:hypothetical protein